MNLGANCSQVRYTGNQNGETRVSWDRNYLNCYRLVDMCKHTMQRNLINERLKKERWRRPGHSISVSSSINLFASCLSEDNLHKRIHRGEMEHLGTSKTSERGRGAKGVASFRHLRLRVVAWLHMLLNHKKTLGQSGPWPKVPLVQGFGPRQQQRVWLSVKKPELSPSCQLRGLCLQLFSMQVNVPEKDCMMSREIHRSEGERERRGHGDLWAWCYNPDYQATWRRGCIAFRL